MTNAGYPPADWKLVVQTYWSPIANGANLRYSESGWTRQSVGGCGVWNRDADWANNTAVVKMNQALTNGVARSGITNYVVLDMSVALNGHRLCERGVGLLEEQASTQWTQPGAADRTEWVNQIRTVTTIFGPYQLPGGHPLQLLGTAGDAQLPAAARTTAVAGSMRCTSTGGVNARNEPNMALTPICPRSPTTGARCAGPAIASAALARRATGDEHDERDREHEPHDEQHEGDVRQRPRPAAARTGTGAARSG